MKPKNTTGNEQLGFELIPPFPLSALVAMLRKEYPERDAHALVRRLLDRKLPPLINSDVLPVAVGVSPKLIFAMAHVPARYYRNFTIGKKRGGKRTISTPRVFLKTIQRWILRNILEKEHFPSLDYSRSL